MSKLGDEIKKFHDKNKFLWFRRDEVTVEELQIFLNAAEENYTWAPEGGRKASECFGDFIIVGRCDLIDSTSVHIMYKERDHFDVSCLKEPQEETCQTVVDTLTELAETFSKQEVKLNHLRLENKNLKEKSKRKTENSNRQRSKIRSLKAQLTTMEEAVIKRNKRIEELESRQLSPTGRVPPPMKFEWGLVPITDKVSN